MPQAKKVPRGKSRTAGWRFDSEIDHNNRFTGKSPTRLDSNFSVSLRAIGPTTLRRCFKTKCAAQPRLQSAAKSLIKTVFITIDQPFGSRTGDAALADTDWLDDIVKRSCPTGPKSARNLISADQSHHRQRNVARNFRR